MTIYEKVMKIYPNLKIEDFIPEIGTISLRDNSDGTEPFIFKWEHPTYPRPTQEQLDAVN